MAMSDTGVLIERFRRHRLLRPGPADAADVVGWLGAVQAQDYRAARWALALRMRGSVTPADIDAALAGGEILRTHVMRPTWHFVARADIRWLLELTAPRVHQALAFGRKAYELDDALQRRAVEVIARSLEREPCLTRSELTTRLARAGIAIKGVRLAFVTIYAELERLICSGPHRGSESTYALLDTRAPQSPRLERDEALDKLTTRYLRSHGPATDRDFSWWSGLTMADAKRGLAIVRARSQTVEGLTYWTLPGRARIPAPSNVVHLLPVFDEYLVAYRDSRPVPRGETSGGFLPQAVVCGGQVIGTWKVRKDREGVDVALTRERTQRSFHDRDLEKAVECYRTFAGIGTRR
jgi:winged helix DNA-binding protein